MQKLNIKTTKNAIPRCYCYSTPTVPEHNGWVKIGYTEQDDVETRINQQLKTANIPHKTEWSDIAVFADGVTYFTDNDFHAYMQKQGVERMRPLPGDTKPPEWFHITGDDSFKMYTNFRRDKGILKAMGTVDYSLRDEQERAVTQTLDYFRSHEKGEFLWNAKPRFGKTLAAYDLCKRLLQYAGKNAVNILIVTNRPAIANSWYDDYVKFLGAESGFLFVSEVSALKGKPYVLTRQQYQENIDDDKCRGCIEFVSLQDLKGSVHFGGEYDKLREVVDMSWTLLVVDEAHEATDTSKTLLAFTQIKRQYTLHLSGTPFKQLANEKFPQDAIFNYSYCDEQKSKRDWDYLNGSNPYESLPRLNLFTYQMSQIVSDEIKRGIEINGEMENYAFDLNEFFAVKPNGKFRYEPSVDKFLDALTTQEKFPFSTAELRAELKHTFWLLNRVDSAKALAKKLKNHPVFKNYEIVLAAGDGKLSEDEEAQKSYDKVRNAIENNDKTITLSVGQLTTGVTVPEWTAVLMLSNLSSPALYMQAAFRAQNPWRYQENGVLKVKENAYVFDFDPARTLDLFEQFANNLSVTTSGGKGDSNSRKHNVRELLNFFPVIGEDENGEMIELDAEKVLSIPRKIRSLEVVNRGFMCNFLFQNISNIFSSPAEVAEIINQLPTASEGEMAGIPTKKELSLNDNGDVELSDVFVVGMSQNIFGDKIYSEISETLKQKTAEVLKNNTPEQQTIEQLKQMFQRNAVDPVMEVTEKNYPDDLKVRDIKSLKSSLEEKTDMVVNATYGEYAIKKNVIESNRKKALETAKTDIQVKEINNRFDRELKKATDDLASRLQTEIKDIVPTLCEEAVKTVETNKREREIANIEDTIREHLRGFARTIPSFLMAYGDGSTTLETFDTIIPEEVFKEVTGITLEKFKFLRDGGDYNDEKGISRHFEGKLFDPVVFNDSVKEFINKKERLSDYFDETQSEDIFDYIPPQKTNQIFTPKKIVRQMVDMLEQENPGCFDDTEKTFIDLYMKSGLYIAEIVKRLHNSDGMKKAFPDEKERLKHIFEKQVYGLAPTEIIYKIAVNFILGFDKSGEITKHNLKQADLLPHAKDGTMEQFLDELYGNTQK